jgi:hypothetical protein
MVAYGKHGNELLGPVKSVEFWVTEPLSDLQKEARAWSSTYVRACSDAHELGPSASIHLEAHWDDVGAEFRQNTDSHFLAHWARSAVGHTNVHPCICRLHAAQQQGATEVCLQRFVEGTRSPAGPPATIGMTRNNEHAWLVAEKLKNLHVAG